MTYTYKIALIFLVFILAACLGSTTDAPTNISTKYEGKVVLYATSWCGYCEKTRNLLKENNIDYIEHDLEKSKIGKTEFDQMGGSGVPLVVVKGKVIKGYSPTKVLEIASGT